MTKKLVLGLRVCTKLRFFEFAFLLGSCLTGSGLGGGLDFFCDEGPADRPPGPDEIIDVNA